jgi:hypothetical protein
MKEDNRVFLAHSSENKVFVRKLAYDLSVRGLPVWLDEWELAVGDSLAEKISEGIDGSGWLLVVLSKVSVISAWVKRELNAGLATELERKDVFVLPALLEDCKLPVFLKDKIYADFRKSYQMGLDALMNKLLPKSRSSLMLENIDDLQLHIIPAFSHGELVTDYDLNRVFQAINILEHRLGLELSDFRLMEKGQVVAARHINQFLKPIERIRKELGLDTSWDYHPVKPMQMYEVEHLNELYGKVNEAIRQILK